MSPRPLVVFVATLPLVLLTALAVAQTGDGRADSYVIASILVAAGCARMATLEVDRRLYALTNALWVVCMPLVAGASTGFALAVVHPKLVEGHVNPWPLLGGAGLGFLGGVVLWPALVVAGAVVQLFAVIFARTIARSSPVSDPA